MKNLKITSFLIVIILVLSGCSGDKCIDADDFGFAKFTISARYNQDELNQQYQGNQIAPWRDSSYRVNGRPLVILVKNWDYDKNVNGAAELSAWCGWYGSEKNATSLSNLCLKLRSCIFESDKMCTETKDAQITNAPCLFKKGVGLYGLIARPGSNPNVSFVSERSPSGITFHLGEPISTFKLYDIDRNGDPQEAGGIIYKYDKFYDRADNPNSTANDIKQTYADNKLYFKILDKYYDDNSGQYKIVIKSGVSDNSPDPIQFLTNLVKDNLFGVSRDDYGLIRNIYSKVTSNPGYQMSVRAILILYLIFTGFSFLTGNLNITHTELIVRILKIIVISTLLSSSYSWTFFNDYLFVYFVGGIEQLLQIINEAAQTGSGSSTIIGLMIAPQTLAKLFSLLFVDWLGLVYIILFMIALYFLFMMILEATVIYLTALIAIGMIIIMGPIFLCFMLFQITRSLFENWLKQLISYAIQPIILFTGIAFISLIVRHEIYGSLGFRVCKHDFPNLGPLNQLFGQAVETGADAIGIDVSMNDSFLYWWFPVPMKAENFSKAKAIIPVPEDHITKDGTLCEAYGCLEERYVALPFLDPVEDKDRIDSFFGGKFVQLDGLLLIFVSVYLLSKFNGISIAVAQFLSSNSASQTSLQSAGLQSFAGMRAQIDRPIKAVKKQVDRGRELISSQVAKTYEDIMLNSVRKDALSKKPNSAVLDEVRRNYDIDYSDVNKDAMKEYSVALQARVRELNPDLSPELLRTKTNELLNKNYDQLDEKFKTLELKALANDVKFLIDFQNAYVETYQAMSARGIGLFGKNIRSLRAIQEINNKIESNKELGEIQKQNRIERALGAIEEGVFGKTLNYEDNRLRTYGEALADQKRDIEYSALKETINRENISTKEDILKPEYIARLETSGENSQARYYKRLAEDKLSYEVRSALTSGEDPAIMGSEFMSKYATDSQLRRMIDKSYEVRKELLENDVYLRREAKYEIAYEKEATNIKEKYDLLKEYYKRDDISVSEIPNLLKNYYEQQATLNYQDAMIESINFQKSVDRFNLNRTVLETMQERKNTIDKEINSNIEEINKKRIGSQMNSYRVPKKVEANARRIRTIEEHLKNRSSSNSSSV